MRASTIWKPPGNKPDYRGDFEEFAKTVCPGNEGGNSSVQNDDDPSPSASARAAMQSILDEAARDVNPEMFDSRREFVQQSAHALDQVFGDGAASEVPQRQSLSTVCQNSVHTRVEDNMDLVKRVSEWVSASPAEEEASEENDANDELGQQPAPRAVVPAPDTGNGLVFDSNINDGQMKVLRVAETYCELLRHHLQNPGLCSAPDNRPLLIHGGPGVGKSFLASLLIKVFDHWGFGSLFTAFTGVAAGNSTAGGRTLCSLLGLGRDIPSCYKDIPLNRVQTLRDRFKLDDTGGKQVRLLLLDEVSFIDARLLGHMDQRLRQITGQHTLPFGGLFVIALGDFFQIPPVGGSSLYKSIMKRFVFQTAQGAQAAPGTPETDGTIPFSTFRKMELTEQMRARQDPEHCVLMKDPLKATSEKLIQGFPHGCDRSSPPD